MSGHCYEYRGIMKGYFIITPIISDGNSLGLVIFYNKDKYITEYNLISKLIALLLARKTDISC